MTAIEMQPGERLGRGLMLLPILLSAVLYLFTTTDRGVIDYDEGYYAGAAKGMAESGNWVTPYVNGIRFLEKPPFLYWMTAASFKVFGINEFALRLPTALAVIALVWIVMLAAQRIADKRTALIAGLSTAFSAGTYIFTRETLHDIWLVLFVALAMYAFVDWYTDPAHSLRRVLLFYVATAGAFMCKSLIGVAFPVGIVVVFFLLSHERPKWGTLHVLPGLLLFLGLTAPWHWLAASQNRGFLDFFFLGEQILRFVGKREPPVLWSLPLATFWALILVWLFPWTAFLPAAIAESRKPGNPNPRVLLILTLAWAGVILGFFSISNRLEHYAFPAFPALSLFIAATLSRSESKWMLWAFRGLAILGILVLVAGIGVGVWIVAGHGLAATSTGPTNRLDETDFSILAEMPAVILSDLLKPAAAAVIAFSIGFCAALWFETRRRRLQAVLCLAGVMMVVCGAIHWSFHICEDLISSKKFAITIAREARSGDRLVVMDDYESANSLNFYEPLPVEICDGIAYALVPGMKYPDAPRIILTRQEFQTVWLSAQRVFALVPKSKIEGLRPDGIEVMRVLHRVLIKNR
jgi:4-amino-4-deoxy-L-arabinose transferase-like glycosyltransferase